MIPKVYVSGALMSARDLSVARAKYELCAAHLRAAGLDAYVPHKSTDPQFATSVSDSDVFEQDVSALVSSDAVVAFLDDPSLGVGAELALAVARDIPIVVVRSPATQVSRFVMGMLKSAQRFSVVPHRDSIDLELHVPAEVRRLIAAQDGSR